MNYAALKTEVQTDPTGQGYASFLPASPGVVINKLNAPIFKMIKSRMITARTILLECAPNGGAILTALNSAPDQNTQWAMKFLLLDSGIDIGNPITLAMIDALVAATSLTSVQANALKAMAQQPASRADIIGFGVVTEADLHSAGIL